MVFLCNRNFQLLADFYSSVYSLLHGFFFQTLSTYFFFIPRFSINMQEVFVDKLFFKKLIYYFAKKKPNTAYIMNVYLLT